MDATAEQTAPQHEGLPDDPTQRWSGYTARVQNDRWSPGLGRSFVNVVLEEQHPSLLEYHEDRKTGKIEAKFSEEWEEDPLSEEDAKLLHERAKYRVRETFFAMDYTHGFTGRGVSPDALERPCLVGPRNETVDERVDPFGGSRNEQIGRSLWKASDGTIQSLPEGVNNDEDVGPLGESRDDEDVGPLGELREDDDVGPLEEPRDEEEVEHLEKLSGIEEKFRQDVEKFAQKVEEECGEQEDEGEVGDVAVADVADAENMSVLMQLAAKSAGMISGTPTVTEDASSPPTATTFPSEPQTPLTFSYSQLTSTPPTASRKRSRDAEEDARDEDSLSQQKRLRMDDVFGIVRKDAGTARVSHIVREAVTPDIRQSRKRSRSPDDGSEDGEDGATKPTPKRLRLYQQLREICEVEEEYVGAGPADAARNGHSTLVYQDVPSSEAQKTDFTNTATTDTKAREEYFVEEEKLANDQDMEREGTRTDDEAAPTQTEWNTAHGINSDCANVRVPNMGIFDLTGEWTKFYLSTSRGLLDRPWTEEEKEDLRVYIQDYRIENWAALSQSTNRTETDLQCMFLEVVAARNRQAGRPERAGIPDRYPNLAPPPPPVPFNPPISAEPAAPAAPATPEEPRKLRAESLIGKSKKNSLGDLTTKRRQPKLEQEILVGSSSSENWEHDESFEAGNGDAASEIQEEEGPLNAIVEERRKHKSSKKTLTKRSKYLLHQHLEPRSPGPKVPWARNSL